MTDNKESDDKLKNNPFLALFPNKNHAQQYVEATKAGFEKSQQLQTQTSTESTGSPSTSNTPSPFKEKKNKLLDKISITNKQFKKTVAERKDVIINDFLQRTFLLTVNCDEDNVGEIQFGGLPQRCIKVPELLEDMIAGDQVPLLNMDNLNQALFERLQMQETVENLCIQNGHRLKAVNAVMMAREELLINYLGECYLRLDQEEESLKRKCAKDKVFMDEITEISQKCFSLISSFTGSILLQPEVFPTENPHRQWFNIMCRSFTEQRLIEFVQKIINDYQESDDVEVIFRPILDNLWQRTQTLKPMDPTTHAQLKTFSYFASSLNLSKLMISSNYWLPTNNINNAKCFETETLLGRFLSVSALPANAMTPTPIFPEPSRQSEAEMQSTTNLVRNDMIQICAVVYEFMKTILQRPETQHDMLHWLGLCMYLNRGRGKMFVPNPMAVSGCGFYLNLTYVLLKFCEPFNPDLKNKTILKVDCRYCSVHTTPQSIAKLDAPLHAIGYSEDEKVVAKPASIPPVLGDKIKFKFVSEIFFLAQQCYHLGYKKIFLSYQELMKQLQKLSTLYRDAQMQGMENPMVNDLKRDFENGMRVQLAMKAVLFPPELSDLVLNFCSATSYWLNQNTIAGGDYLNMVKPREMKAKNLPEEVSPALTVVPEFIFENIGDTIRLMGLFNEESLDRYGNLSHIMEFFAIFLGEPYRVKNPHLRAKLAECFTAFVPRTKVTSNMFTFSYRRNAFEASTFVPKVLPKSLLRLFVDIEFTGHAMEFEQKFTYRHYMYEILEYIWKLPGYHESFRKLYEDGKVMYKKEMVFTCFPRFINLLVNDSTFLLDEALQNLTMIKTLEQEKDNGEWNLLESAEMRRKEENLTQFGHFARAYNTMAKETVHVLCYITKDITRPFASPCMATSMAAFLNYFLVHLVGPKRKELKVKDFEKYNFEPSTLVINIACIYISLAKEDSFCQAIVTDERCYSNELFTRCLDLLEKLEGGQMFIPDMAKVNARLKKWHDKLVARETPVPPDEFLDPISCVLMHEPVKLPSSGQILCRSTIARHLLSDENDPFNRSPLKLDQVIPCPELQERIYEWMTENGIEQPDLTADDCGG
ncbi:ubiquitin conjugation factor E4 A-like [Clytia hemisphaerica]|uniref:Ubiquitin conjugation factor E4 A n=1 Tax=Clytia hemisphaerica TaxID=252671 RepID=A0A7M5XJK4_9CNID